MKKASEIKTYMEKWPGHPYDAIKQVVHSLPKIQDEPWTVIKEILDWQVTEESLDKQLMEKNNEDLKEATFHYRRYLIDLVNVLGFDNPTEEEFYKHLYQQIFLSGLFPGEDEKALCLFIMVRDLIFIPYHQALNPLKLDNQEYSNIIQRIWPQIQLARYMKTRMFDTRTEEASQFWEVANTLETREDQIVFWSTVLIEEARAATSSSNRSNKED